MVLFLFFRGWGVVVDLGVPGSSPVRAVRAVRAGCCVASAGVALFGLGVVWPVQEPLCLL